MLKFGSENKECDNFPFVIEIDDADNVLKILFALPKIGEKGSNVEEDMKDEIKELLKETYPIYPDEKNVYEITFEDYIFYQVRNESYCTYDDYEISKGRHLIIFEKSRLLDYLSTATICCKLDNGDFFPGEWKHYEVSAENQIIDVITCDEPIIRKIDVK